MGKFAYCSIDNYIHLNEAVECMVFVYSSMSCFCCGRLRSMFLAGERCDVETLDWAKRSFGVPILDHWWQTGRTRAHQLPAPGQSSLPRLPARITALFSRRRRAEEMFQGLCERSRGSEPSALLSARRLEGITRSQGGSRGRRPAFRAGPRSMNPLAVL